MKELDPVIHSQLRLAICAILAEVGETDFMTLRNQTDSTMGNLSVQLTKLEEAGYISVEKTFRNKRPHTLCRLTEKGKKAFIDYVTVLGEYIEPVKSLLPSGRITDLVPGLM